MPILKNLSSYFSNIFQQICIKLSPRSGLAQYVIVMRDTWFFWSRTWTRTKYRNHKQQREAECLRVDINQSKSWILNRKYLKSNYFEKYEALCYEIPYNLSKNGKYQMQCNAIKNDVNWPSLCKSVNLNYSYLELQDIYRKRTSYYCIWCSKD